MSQKVFIFSSFILIPRRLHPAGVEPATYGSVGHCSIQLSYGCSFHFKDLRQRLFLQPFMTTNWTTVVSLLQCQRRKRPIRLYRIGRHNDHSIHEVSSCRAILPRLQQPASPRNPDLTFHSLRTRTVGGVKRSLDRSATSVGGKIPKARFKT